MNTETTQCEICKKTIQQYETWIGFAQNIVDAITERGLVTLCYTCYKKNESENKSKVLPGNKTKEPILNFLNE